MGSPRVLGGLPNRPTALRGVRVNASSRPIEGVTSRGGTEPATLMALAAGPGPVVDGELDADGASLRSEAR